MPGGVAPLYFSYRGVSNCCAYFTLLQETQSYLQRENVIVLRKDGSLNCIDYTGYLAILKRLFSGLKSDSSHGSE